MPDSPQRCRRRLVELPGRSSSERLRPEIHQDYKLNESVVAVGVAVTVMILILGGLLDLPPLTNST